MLMLVRLAFFATWLLVAPAFAQTLSPFDDPSEIAQARGVTQNAALRISYATTTTAADSAAHNSDLVFDVGADWVLVRSEQQAALYDYKLDRLFLLSEQAHTFVSYNIAAPVAFRVMERQNRSYLARILERAGGHELADDCDAETELSVVFPGSASQINLRSNVGSTELQCNGRTIGSFTASSGAPPPTSFWPAFAIALNLHPALFERIRASGHAPARVTSTFRDGTGRVTQLEYRLSSVSTIDEPYPIAAPMANGNVAAIDAALESGVGAAASDADAGRAMGGVPTFASWGAHLAQIGARDGPAAVAMLVGVSYNMFPQAEDACAHGDPNQVCVAMRNLADAMDRDAAVHAMYAIATAEQENRLADVIPAMRSAQRSPLAHDPVLGESYALALLRFDQTLMNQARAANLPTDPKPLMAAALRAHPYNAAYWTDVGGWLSQQYEWQDAMLFYDVANALPYPEARQNSMMQSFNQFLARLRHDFPNFWLSQ